MTFSSNKSEAFLIHRGKGSKSRYADLGSKDFKLPLRPLLGGSDGSSDFLRMVSSYKHMGSILHTSGSLSAEVSNRCTSFLSAYRLLAGRVFRNNIFTHDVRKQLVQSLLMSRQNYPRRCS